MNALTGSSATALIHYEHALRGFQRWRMGALGEARRAVEAAPGFVMAQVLRAYILTCGREGRNLVEARAALAALGKGVLTDAERAHVAIASDLCHLQLERGLATLDDWLARHPADGLALQVAHAFDYLLGDTLRLRDRVEQALPRWSPAMPGYDTVVAMHAFGLAENQEYARAAERCMQTLALDAGNARAHHAMAHVYENAGMPEAGLKWLDAHRHDWAEGALVSTHLWWHEALLWQRGDGWTRTWRIYDERLAPARADVAVADLVDATSLLWRLYLQGADVAARAEVLADCWSARLDEGFCSFNDLHAAMALAMASRWRDMQRLVRTQLLRATQSDSYAATTREVGYPACQGVLAFGQERYDCAVDWLAALPARAYRIGGSGAQRSVLMLTLRAARNRRVEGAPRPEKSQRSRARVKASRESISSF